jgi:alginate O-acetyltransferase complex protein AlgI
MVFSSSIFLYLFLPIFLLVYHLVARAYKNLIIVLGSILFYAWGAPSFVFFLIGLMVIDFYVVKAQYQSQGVKRKQALLITSVCLNLSALAYFKYSNFFVENLNVFTTSLFNIEIPWMHVALPIGISFYTFHALSYSIDVYRGVHKPMEKLSEYILYILAFPQLIAGPIVRFNTIADQITNRKETLDDKLFGFFRFSIGLAKKMLIANSLGAQADAIMNLSPDTLSTTSAWVGIIAYTFQLYFDFSAYSDMALGLGKIMGFTFPENFNSPYIAQNITEFWRRWHISLSSWMRDYLYIPLGGNRVKTKSRAYLNLWIVFLLSGLSPPLKT